MGGGVPRKVWVGPMSPGKVVFFCYNMNNHEGCQNIDYPEFLAFCRREKGVLA